MTDSRKPDLVLSQLEVEEVGPYVVGLSGGKRITFPDPGAMNAFEADEFANDLMTARSAEAVFSRWLTEADVKKLMSAVQAHYKAAFGEPGEGDAS